MKYTKEEIVEAKQWLLKILKPGETVYTVLRSVSSSGMFRRMDLYVLMEPEKKGGKARIQWITSSVAKLVSCRYTREDWNKSKGLGVGGCGMDMGFHVVYSLSRTLFPDGFKVMGVGRNGDTSGHDRDGGYALKQEWI